MEAADGLEETPLSEERASHIIQLGRDIEDETKRTLVSLLREYQDIFAFGLEEMLGIILAIMEHQLNIDPTHRPVVQKQRHMSPERAAAMTAEVQKLLEASFIREC